MPAPSASLGLQSFPLLALGGAYNYRYHCPDWAIGSSEAELRLNLPD
jgi:hypothetical protein